MTGQSLRVLLSIAAIGLLLAVFAGVGYWISWGGWVNVTVERQLVGPEEALALVLNGAPLTEIEHAVARSGKHVDEIAILGGSLLYWSIDEKRLDVARWLLDKGANPNGIHPSMVPLAQAIRKENVELVSLLVASGADPDLDMKYGITPRSIAVSIGNEEMLGLLNKP